MEVVVLGLVKLLCFFSSCVNVPLTTLCSPVFTNHNDDKDHSVEQEAHSPRNHSVANLLERLQDADTVEEQEACLHAHEEAYAHFLQQQFERHQNVLHSGAASLGLSFPCSLSLPLSGYCSGSEYLGMCVWVMMSNHQKRWSLQENCTDMLVPHMISKLHGNHTITASPCARGEISIPAPQPSAGEFPLTQL